MEIKFTLVKGTKAERSVVSLPHVYIELNGDEAIVKETFEKISQNLEGYYIE